MPFEIGNPRLTEALGRALGLRGYLKLDGLDERVIATLPLFQLGESPYMQQATPAMRAEVPTAVVGGLPTVSVRAGPGRALRVTELILGNQTGGVILFEVRLVRPGAAGYTVQVTDNLLACNQLWYPIPAAGQRELPSVIERGTVAAVLGSRLMFGSMGNNQTLTLPCEVVLNGDDPAGSAQLMVFCLTANVTNFGVGFKAREWLLP